MPKDGFNKLIAKATAEEAFRLEFLNPYTRRQAIEKWKFKLNDDEITDLISSTATKLSDIVVDFNPTDRYHDD